MTLAERIEWCAQSLAGDRMLVWDELPESSKDGYRKEALRLAPPWGVKGWKEGATHDHS